MFKVVHTKKSTILVAHNPAMYYHFFRHLNVLEKEFLDKYGEEIYIRHNVDVNKRMKKYGLASQK